MKDGLSLRPYQTEACAAVLGALGEKPWHADGDETFRSALLNLATSAGKTVIAGAVITAVKDRGKCLYLADTDELCVQPLRKFYRLFGIHAALEKADERASLLAPVVVGSAQTLARPNRLERFASDHFRFVLVDEAHRGSDRNKKISDYFAKAKVIGMTATAFRARLADLSDYYETVAYELGVFDLIEQGYNTPLKVMTLPVSINLRDVHQSMTTEGMDYDKSDLDTTIAPYYEEICRLVLKHAADRHIICYLPLIKSSQEFVKIAQAHGINAWHIDGTSPDRRELLRRFEGGQIQLLSNSSLLTTGWDAPRCDCLLNLAPTRSAGLFRQKAGRIGRVLPGCVDGVLDKDERKHRIASSAKPDALILDLLWQAERFGLQGPADLIAANSGEKEALQMRLRKLSGAVDLQETSSAVQEEREERLRDELEAAARRKATATDAVNIIAATLHGSKVLNYEPVVNWEAKPVTDKQREWLLKNGIDPGSARDRGHVSALMNLIFARREAKLAPWRVVRELQKRGFQQAARTSAANAFTVLGGDYPCGFGTKYMGRPLKSVPQDFWEWCVGKAWFPIQFPIEYRWAAQVLPRETLAQLRRGNCTCIGAYIAPNCPQHSRARQAGPVSALTADAFENLS